MANRQLWVVQHIAYGVQVITAPGSHTIGSDAMSGSAVYVGMTRGTDDNVLHIVAENTAEARQQFIDAVERNRADRGLTDATQQAAKAVRGLVEDGPVKLVRTEIAALERRAEHAEANAALWQQAADALDELHARQRSECEQATEVNEAAKQRLELVRAEVAEPLIAQARAALTDWQDADAAQQTARDKVRAAGRFKKRRAATHALHAMIDPNPWPSISIYARIFGEGTVRKNPGAYVNARPARQAADAIRTAQQAWAEAETLRALTPSEAVERIAQTRAAEDARRDTARMLAERERQLRVSRAPHSGPSHDRPSLGR